MLEARSLVDMARARTTGEDLEVAATYSSLVGIALGGKYEIRRVLGAGGMGVVCEAVHRDLGKQVAVKLIDRTMKESEIIVARFRREARAAGQIRSEHIVDVFDVGADPRVGLYMVMEHLTGEDLQGRLDRDKRLDVETGVMVAHQIASGLAKAHEAGVVHRDLKPANVYLTQRDSGHLLVKLLDFGVSKLLGQEPGTARITGRGAPIGTPLYMSPEQAEGKDDVDGRADIWSLGAVLYEALSGMPPFADRGSYHGTLVGILTSQAKPLHEVAAWVPPALAKVVDAMLVHDRAARLPSAAVVRKCLVEAFPAVAPDGTGKHMAVIVQGATAAVDVTGDTEVFTRAALEGATQPVGASPPTAATTRLEDREEPPRTISDAHEASRGGAFEELHDRLGSGPRTVRLPLTLAPSSSEELTSAPPAALAPGSDPSAAHRALPSSSGGISLPATPPIIEPLPPSELAPPTVRDDVLALRAERRRRMRLVSVGLVVIGLAAGAFFVGRRTTPSAPPTAAFSPPSAPTAEAPTSATAAPSEVAPPTPMIPSDALPDAGIEGTPATSAAATVPRRPALSSP